MISDNYYNTDYERDAHLTSFEEELLLNYEDYLKQSSFYSLKAENHYDIEMDDLNQEYDENDWEEVDENENHEEDIQEPDTF